MISPPSLTTSFLLTGSSLSTRGGGSAVVVGKVHSLGFSITPGVSSVIISIYFPTPKTHPVVDLSFHYNFLLFVFTL
jgi:hypothetical protein